jgi:predicted ATPase
VVLRGGSDVLDLDSGSRARARLSNAAAICDALRIARVPGEGPEAALERVLAGERTTLVLDNFEHLDGVEAVIARLLHRLPDLTVVGTSRQPLALQAEQRFPVAPLVEAEAVRLLVVASACGGARRRSRGRGAG